MRTTAVLGFGNPPVLDNHAFEGVNGELVHTIADRVLAIVPPEGFEDYCRQWPAAKEVCFSMLGRSPQSDEDLTVNEDESTE